MMGVMAEAEGIAGLDTSVAHPARVYDYWLGGKDNFAVDRAVAEATAKAVPGVVQGARDNRAFLGRAQQLSPDIRDDMGNRLLADLSRSAGPLPPGMSPWTYLQTVLAERSRRETHRLSGAATGVKEPERPTAQPPGPFSPPS